MQLFDDDRDSAIAELLRRAYARKVDIDTAARHLWAIDAAARAARATQEPTGVRRTPAGRPGRSRRALVAVLTSFMLVASSGAALAAVAGSSATLPGDPLYSLKRSGERVRLVLAVRPETDAKVHLSIAEQRWSEVQHAAQARPDVVPGLLEDTFDALRAAESRGGPVAEQAVALRTQVATSSAELAFGSPPTDAAADEEADAARRAAEDPAPAAPGDAGTDDAADEVASGDGAATDAGAPALAAGPDAPAATAPSAAPAEPEAPAESDAQPVPAIGDAAAAPEPTSSPTPPPPAPAPDTEDPQPAEEQPVVGGQPTMAQPADAGDSSGQVDSGGEPARGDGGDAPVAPTQPAPAATGEQTAPAAPETPPSAPGWGRPHP